MALALRSSIEHGGFWHLDTAPMLRLIAHAFAPELKRLLNAPAAAEQPSSRPRPSDPGLQASPSYILYGAEHDEVNRTMTGILAMKWILTGDYESFAACQDPKIRIRPASFQQLEKLFAEKLAKSDDQLALIVNMIVNDLGKDPMLHKDLAQKTGKPYAGQNHDAVLFDAVNAGMVDCLEMLDHEQAEDLKLGLRMGAQLNLGQLAQAENVPGSLEIVLTMQGHNHAFDLKFMEQIVDVAGAAGHVNHRCAQPMGEPVYQAFMTVYKVLTSIIQGQRTLREGYDDVLAGRASILAQKGFRELSVTDADERALLRLITMGRTTEKEQAEWFSLAFDSLPNHTRVALVDGLSVDGYKDGKAILPYYMPALLQAALTNTRDGSAAAKSDALASLMRFLTKVLDGTYPSPGSPGEVIEHDLMFAKKTICSDDFKYNPAVLDELNLNIMKEG